MLVTRVEELNKTRCKVYIEQEFAFVLYKGELRLYRVKEGQDLAAETYETIIGQVLPKRAKLRAMNLLQKREYTTAQLRDKLKQGFYPAQVIEDALNYVASFRYIDDCRYATDYIRCNESSRSRKRIEQDLLGKGVSREVIQKAWQEWEELGGVQDEDAMIRKLLEKRKFNPEEADFGRRQKEAAFLMRKGFSGESIRRVLQDFEYDV